MKYLIFCFASIVIHSCVNKDISVSSDANSQSAEIAKKYFFLDDKQVSFKVVGEGLTSDEIEYINWSNGTRDALLRFGEKYRGGIYIFKTKTNEK